jgi:phosphatidylinositol alpha 1,6-mannosyltransferase
MPRRVDCEQFHPDRRTVRDGIFRLGYVGRVTPEENVRLFADIERALLAAGRRNFSIMVVGDGSERSWLEHNLSRGVFTGVLRGPLLAEAYANIDLFVFPSHTDTYGNVVQEAAASGVPAIVTADGGPQHLVTPGVTGFVAKDDRIFIEILLQAIAQPERLRTMGMAAREAMLSASWDNALEMTYAAYRFATRRPEPLASLALPPP